MARRGGLFPDYAIEKKPLLMTHRVLLPSLRQLPFRSQVQSRRGSPVVTNAQVRRFRLGTGGRWGHSSVSVGEIPAIRVDNGGNLTTDDTNGTDKKRLNTVLPFPLRIWLGDSPSGPYPCHP